MSKEEPKKHLVWFVPAAEVPKISGKNIREFAASFKGVHIVLTNDNRIAIYGNDDTCKKKLAIFFDKHASKLKIKSEVVDLAKL